MELFKNKKVLFIGAHPDDVELGCGGTVCRAIKEEAEVYYAVFSKCQKSIPEGFDKDVLVGEMAEASKALGIKSTKLFDFEVRDFPANRQEILETLVSLKKEINPDIVFIPSSFDTHQDHKTIHEEGVRAFNQKTIFGYELPWTNRSFDYSAFVVLNDELMDKKIKAMKEYKSQSKRKYMDEDFIRGWARMRGMQSDTKYAEAFETIQLTVC